MLFLIQNVHQAPRLAVVLDFVDFLMFHLLGSYHRRIQKIKSSKAVEDTAKLLLVHSPMENKSTESKSLLFFAFNIFICKAILDDSRWYLDCAMYAIENLAIYPRFELKVVGQQVCEV